jgi:hypothetical protein
MFAEDFLYVILRVVNAVWAAIRGRPPENAAALWAPGSPAPPDANAPEDLDRGPVARANWAGPVPPGAPPPAWPPRTVASTPTVLTCLLLLVLLVLVVIVGASILLVALLL